MGERAEQVVPALPSRQDWLVIFYNAPRPIDLAGWLPGGTGHVLITSPGAGRPAAGRGPGLH
jgi:hypothetical protein